MVKLIYNSIPDPPESKYHNYFILDEEFLNTGLHIETAETLTDALTLFSGFKLYEDNRFSDCSNIEFVNHLRKKKYQPEIIYISVDHLDYYIYRNELNCPILRLSNYIPNHIKEMIDEYQTAVNSGNVEEILDFKQRFYNANKENC